MARHRYRGHAQPRIPWRPPRNSRDWRPPHYDRKPRPHRQATPAWRRSRSKWLAGLMIGACLVGAWSQWGRWTQRPVQAPLVDEVDRLIEELAEQSLAP